MSFVPEFIRTLDALNLLARKLLAGEDRADRPTPRRGASLEFADYRRYAPGDEIRYIDWNVYARHGSPVVKEFAAEQNVQFSVLLDASASIAYGKASKFEGARELAALTGASATFIALDTTYLDRHQLRWFEQTLGPPIQFIGKTKTGQRDEARTRQVESSKGYMAAKELVYDSILRRATDIHLEPKEDEMGARIRIDGVMYPTEPFDRPVGDAITNIFKVLSAMDITERRRPQDGSFGALVEGREVDFRVASQGTRLGRAGRVHIDQDGDGTVWVGGATVTHITGDVDL